MAPDISSVTVKKAMRVATVFTGAAACAAFFAPAANAQTAAALAPRATTVPDFSRPACSNSHLFHLVTQTSQRCYGGQGWEYPDTSMAVEYCGGNNYGVFSGYSDSGYGAYYGDQGFEPGSTYYNFTTAPKYDKHGTGWDFEMSAVYLSGWYGTGPLNKACPYVHVL
jgi:hypothetical protein